MSIDAELQQDAEALYEALAELVHVYQYRDRDRICCHDISVTQCNAMEALVQLGPVRLQTLAERLLLDKSTASRVVDSLERKHYVARLPDPSDGRAQLLHLTENGLSLYHTIRNEIVAEERALIADLPPEVRKAAPELLRRLARAAKQRTTDSNGCAVPTSKTGPCCD